MKNKIEDFLKEIYDSHNNSIKWINFTLRIWNINEYILYPKLGDDDTYNVKNYEKITEILKEVREDGDMTFTRYMFEKEISILCYDKAQNIFLDFIKREEIYDSNNIKWTPKFWGKVYKPQFYNTIHKVFQIKIFGDANNAISINFATGKCFDFDTFFKDLMRMLLEYHILDKVLHILINEIKNRSIKSATAAIMARNMSHNLGSHILFYLKSILVNVPKQWENLIYELEKENDKESYILNIHESLKDKITISHKNNDIDTPFLKGIGKFLGYLQERQDFIATIASNYIPYFGTVNFKDFIYDEINPDLKVKRHKNSQNIRNILLDFIAESEGFSRNERDNIQVFFGNFDGSESNSEDLERLRNIKMDMPAGIMGRQAFFSIFENIIRNAAKHKPKNNNRTLKITIDAKVSDEFPDYWEVKIYDNNKNYQDVEEKIKEGLNDSYIDDKGELKHENKGIKEMRISAAWLRGYSVSDIDESNMDPKILDIEKIDQNLAYKFYIPISKKLVYITSDKSEFSKKSIFNNQEYQILSPEEYLKLKNTNFRITLIDDQISDEQKDIKKKAPVRIFEIENKKLAGFSSGEELYLHFYEKWIKENFPGSLDKEKKRILIFDHNTSINNEDGKDYICLKGSESENLEECGLDEENLIIFRKHNDTESEFEAFQQTDLYNTASFIEGITGHNSTERIIRNDRKDLEWVYKITEAALTKVLIIDERIFKRLALPEKEQEINISVEEILKHSTDTETLKDFLKSKGVNDKALKKINLLINSITNNTDKVKQNNTANKIVKRLTKKRFISEKNLNLDIYGKKNLEIINITFAKNKAQIWNLNNEKIFSFGNDDIDGINNPVDKEYDFVLIHQGILDKLYTTFNPTDKKEIWKCLKKLFPAKHKFIVHSGRSKPHDLPEGAGFNQFSSVETALFDCKLSLSELLYSVKTE